MQVIHHDLLFVQIDGDRVKSKCIERQRVNSFLPFCGITRGRETIVSIFVITDDKMMIKLCLKHTEPLIQGCAIYLIDILHKCIYIYVL